MTMLAAQEPKTMGYRCSETHSLVRTDKGFRASRCAAVISEVLRKSASAWRLFSKERE